MPIRSFAVLPSGDVLAGNGHQLYQWNAAGALVRSVPNATCDRLAPAGGSVLLVSDGPRLEVYDGATLEPASRLVDPSLRRAAHDGVIRSIAVHPSGAFVATAADHDDRTVKVWELASGRLVTTVTSAGTEPIMIAWSGDGTYLLATTEGRVERWRFAPAEVERFVCFAALPLEAAAVVHGGSVAALGSVRNGSRALLVGCAAGGPRRTVSLADGGGNGQAALAADPVGGLAITTGSPGIRLWNPDTPVPVALTARSSRQPQFGPDGAGLWAVVDSDSVCRYDPVTKVETARWSNDMAGFMTGLSSLNALAVGRRVAVAGGRDGAVYVLDPQTCRPTGSASPNVGDPVLAAAVTPDDALALAGTQSGKLRVVRTADRTELSAAAAHSGGVTAVAIDRTGTLLVTGGRDRAVRVWKRTGDRFETLFTVSDLPSVATALRFDPAGGRLMVLLASEHAVRVWDVDRLRAELGDLKLGW
ncbi:WD40 repeat domain-containing protein [Frigoriglobus tundricola]|uniref:WD40 repeat domain-containing protein n=1 Tax=Frigoriglobus tundricola TaxID=2774151 RepID=UPI00148EBDF5|nr:WD40 repeat domain-containing protein [Frigoriglobus tundricola]